MFTKMNSGCLDSLVDEMLLLLKETEEYHSVPDVKAMLQEAGKALLSIRRRLRMLAQQYAVGVVGLTNVGKSTLLNALLGSDIAPRRNGPCTSAPIEFAFGDSIVVTAYLKKGLNRPSWKCGGPDEIHSLLNRLGDDTAGFSSNNINRIVVSIPHPLLSNGLVIADTPGFGAAQIGDAEGTHEQSLKEYLRRGISQVFWVVLADQGIGSREKRFHDDFFAEVCDDLVVTGCDDWDNNDREKFRKRFLASFGSRLPKFHFVSGLQGLEARKAQDQSGLESAGITALEERIRDLANPQGREASVRRQLEQLTQDIAWWWGDHNSDGGRLLQPWWRPDSWSRFSAMECGDPFAITLKKNLRGRN